MDIECIFEKVSESKFSARELYGSIPITVGQPIIKLRRPMKWT